MNSERKNLIQPVDWWAAFQAEAKREGVSLSEWLGDCGRANLPKDVKAGLSERATAGRPKKVTT